MQVTVINFLSFVKSIYMCFTVGSTLRSYINRSQNPDLLTLVFRLLPCSDYLRWDLAGLSRLSLDTGAQIIPLPEHPKWLELQTMAAAIWLFIIFETGPLCGVQAGLEVVILLPQFAECWDLQACNTMNMCSCGHNRMHLKILYKHANKLFFSVS